jgi:hypothetical protein
MYTQFSELTFYQDSVNPLTIHAVFKAVAEVHCDFSEDETSVIWGDGASGYVYIGDTFPISAQDPLQVYYATHTYDTLPSDSIVYFSFSSFAIPSYVTNSFSPPSGLLLGTQATLNFKYLKSTLGFHSPVFDGSYFIYDTVFQVLTYDPQVSVDSPFHVHVGIVQPYSFINQQILAITPLNYPTNPSNNYSVDINTGILVWDTAQFHGGYLFTYLVYTYDTAGNFVCANSRNMIIQVADTLSQNTGISMTSTVGSRLQCYPSPTSGSFTIDMTGYGGGKKQISIYDQLGQIVYQTQSTKDKLQVSDKLSSGIYTVSVTQDSRREYARIVVE